MIATVVFLLVLTLQPAQTSAETLDHHESAHFSYHIAKSISLSAVDSALNYAKSHLTGLLQDTIDYRPSIYIVESPLLFDSLIGGKFPDWGAAAAIPHRKMAVIKSPRRFNISQSLQELLIHEYSHLALADRTGLFSAPRWFDEGLSMRASSEWDWSNNLAMSKAAVFNQLIPLSQIDDVNMFNENQAQTAYSTSFVAVNYLFDTYGVIVVNQFLDSISTGVSVDRALLYSTGSNYPDFEREFHVYLNSRFNAVSLLADTMYFWLIIALFFVVVGIVKYRQRRKFYKKWQDEERLQSTDFDYGDSDKPEQADLDDDERWRQ